MGLVPSNIFLEIGIFTAGTFVGGVFAYILARNKATIKQVNNKQTQDKIWKDGMEERYEFEDPHDEYRLIMAVRNDLKMQKGKVAAQCGHAAVSAYAKALKRPKLLENWLRNGGTKIAVRIDSEKELFELQKTAKQLNVLSSVIRDAGQTQVTPGTRTVIAIGPAPKSILDQITGHLKLY